MKESEMVSFKTLQQYILDLYQRELKSIPDDFIPADEKENETYLWPVIANLLDYVKDRDSFAKWYEETRSTVFKFYGDPFEDEYIDE